MNGLIYLLHFVRAGQTDADEEGQGLVEYGLILGLIGMMLVTALNYFGTQLTLLFGTIANSIPS